MAAASESYQLYPLAVLLPIFASLVVLLDVPPLVWHVRHRNVGAASLILHTTFLNFMNFVNPLIWPRDNIHDWFNGNVLCDVEVRLHLFASFGAGTSLICIFKSLANVLDANRTTASMSSSCKRKKAVLDLLLCFGAPLLFILSYYIVQSQRYAIDGIYGCTYMIEGSWVSLVLVSMWFPLLHLIAAVYAGIVIFRLAHYSRMFGSMLQNHNTTRSRFWRTFIMSSLIIMLDLPAILYIFASNFPLSTRPYSWSYVHDEWNVIYKHPSRGRVHPEVWCNIIGGIFVFFFFGTGQEAIKMYKRWLASLGFGRIWPSLLQESVLTSSSTSTDQWSLLSKRAKHFLSKWVPESLIGASSSDDWSIASINTESKSMPLSPVDTQPSPLLPIAEPRKTILDAKPESQHTYSTNQEPQLYTSTIDFGVRPHAEV